METSHQQPTAIFLDGVNREREREWYRGEQEKRSEPILCSDYFTAQNGYSYILYAHKYIYICRLHNVQEVKYTN